MLTASRQILLLQLPLYVFFFYWGFLRGKLKGIKKVFTITLILVIASYAAVKFFDVYEGSYLQKRVQINVEEDSRMVLAKEALTVGVEHPIFGVGPGNFLLHSKSRHFSHITYLELFANGGILPFVIFLIMIVSFMRIQYARYKRYHDNVYMYFLTFGIFFAMDNFFYVFYSSPQLMSFFFLVYTHSNLYELEHNSDSKNACELK